MYFEIGVLTESELTNLTSLPSTALKMKACKMQLEDGSRTPVHLVSLAGLSCGQVHGMRKMKVYCDSFTSHVELLLQAAQQLRQDQGAECFDFASAQAAKARPDPLSPVGRLRVQSLADAIETARGITQSRLREQQLAAEEEEDASDNDGDDLESLLHKAEEREQEISLVKPQFSSMSKRQRVLEPAKKKKAKRKASQSPDRSLAGKSSLISLRGEEDEIVDISALDPEMQMVASKYSTPPVCLKRLNVNRILAGEFLGRSIAAAARINLAFA